MKSTTKISYNRANSVRIYVDDEQISEILNFLFEQENYANFYIFKNFIFENRFNNEIYQKVKQVKNVDNLYELRFRRGKGQNDRIYCREIHDGARNIILCRLYIGKKTQKIDKRILSILKAIGQIHYKIKP